MAKETNKQKLEKKIWAKVEDNIDGICFHKKIKNHIILLRETYKIPNNFFKDNKSKLKETTDLGSLLDQLFDIWKNTIPESGSTIEEINQSISLLHDSYDEIKKEAEKYDYYFPTKKEYAVQKLRDFMDGKSIIYYFMKRNSDIWKQVINARLFGIPKKELLNYRESIVKSYLPQVDNELVIKMNELTTIDDIKYIWPDIRKKKKEFQEKHNLQNVKKKYPNFERDKKAYELHVIKGVSQLDTREKMIEEGWRFPKDSSYTYIAKMIQRFKKRIGEISDRKKP